MPGEYKVKGSAVEACRRFYLGEKMHFASWTRRTVSYWARAVSLIRNMPGHNLIEAAVWKS